jgi:hypothetical protein
MRAQNLCWQGALTQQQPLMYGSIVAFGSRLHGGVGEFGLAAMHWPKVLLKEGDRA